MSIIAALNRAVHKRRDLLNDRSTPKYWLCFLGAAFVVLILTLLFQKGCFLDGMLYKTVAYNYANEHSTFWQMKFTNTSMYEFCEQPPLYFYLLGNFYKAFGVHDLTDRFFTLLLFCLLFLVLRAILKQFFHTVSPYFLLALFFLLAIPVFCWSYVNQVIEPLLCVFTALAIWCFATFTRSDKNYLAVVFAVLLCLLFLTKGIQSCFIAVLPLIYGLVSKLKKAPLTFFAIATLLFVLSACVCLQFFPSATYWFNCYYQTRLVLTMQNVGATTDNHFEIIVRFFSELMLCLIVVVILAVYLATIKKYPVKLLLKNFMANKMALSLMITAFAGSLPYAVSLVQRGFYLIPAFICFVLAILLGFRRYWIFACVFFARIVKPGVVRVLFVLVLLGSVVYFCFNVTAYKRNKALLTDLEQILPYLPKGGTVLIEEARWNDFSLHAYAYMAKEVSLSTDRRRGHFLIRDKDETFRPNDSLYKIALNTGELDLFVILKWKNADSLEALDVKELWKSKD